MRLSRDDFANSLDVLAVEVLAIDPLEVIGEDIEDFDFIGVVSDELLDCAVAFVF
jgi:hypothetical protein